MVRTHLRPFMIAAVVVLAACGTPPPSSQPQPAAAPSRTISGDDRIGVAECDDYLDRYEACLDAHVAQEARDALRVALQQTRANWRKSVAASGNPGAMAKVCSNARAAARPSLAARGCADF